MRGPRPQAFVLPFRPLGHAGTPTSCFCTTSALDDSDQTRKYGISESLIQAFIMSLLQTQM